MSEIRVTSIVGENGSDPVGLSTGFTVGPTSGTTATITHEGQASFTGIVTATSFVPTEGQLSHRNKVHNGDMRISQRYGTTAHTPSSTTRNYVIDRWAYWSNQASKTSIQQVTDAPAGFKHSAKCTSLSAHTADAGHWFGYTTTIEAQDIYDLAQGTANAKSFTLSFYVKSSITGTWAAAVRTKPGSPSRSYPFNYTINSQNTWERKTITIPGSTDGTWLTDNNEGICIWFDLGTGSTFHATANQWYSGNAVGPSASPFIAVNGATWLVTGVQLEVGSVATPFEHRSYADELRRCQRYFFNITGNNGSRSGIPGYANSTSSLRCMVQFPAPMRAIPTVSGSSTAMVFDSHDDSASFNCSSLTAGGAPTTSNPTQMCIEVGTSGMTNGQGGQLEFRAANGFINFSAEL